MHWGLSTPQNFHINARIESVSACPRFRESWCNNRRLLPANGFYEWHKDGVYVTPHCIHPTDGKLHFLAGLCFPKNKNDQMDNFLILTTEASSSVRNIHKRMPLIIKVEYCISWLNGEIDETDTREISEQIRLDMHMISESVNRVENNDESLKVELTLCEKLIMLF